jgi:UDP-N-acetylglucosamine 2-epimerase (non-hydrolysing)
MKIISVVGARPNFIKIAPFIKAIDRYNASLPSSTSTSSICHLLVHTGQHYDDRMSNSFFEQLDIPQADINLGIGSGTHAEQVGKTMMEFEKVIKQERPDWIVVVGDVNATLACSITAKKELIKCCHIEAGLRSGDMSMPEEINRLVTDRLSDLLLTPDILSSENLRKEGISEDRIRFVGNIMIDTLDSYISIASKLVICEIISNSQIDKTDSGIFKCIPEYGLLTLHRPSNVDNRKILVRIMEFIHSKCKEGLAIIWPIHPRTYKRLEEFDLISNVRSISGLILTQPLGYLEMLRLNMSAKVMLTDSGGLQEECTVLGTPCITMRLNTERPITLREYGGASVLVGNRMEIISVEFNNAIKGGRKPHRPDLWDGMTANRCLDAILNYKDS